MVGFLIRVYTAFEIRACVVSVISISSEFGIIILRQARRSSTSLFSRLVNCPLYGKRFAMSQTECTVNFWPVILAFRPFCPSRASIQYHGRSGYHTTTPVPEGLLEVPKGSIFGVKARILRMANDVCSFSKKLERFFAKKWRVSGVALRASASRILLNQSAN